MSVPDVPNVPGVPALSSYLTQNLGFLTADAVSLLVLALPPTWGIFLDGIPVLPKNSTINFSYRQDWTISNYPVEEGGFQSYDKVQLPFDVRIRVVSGSTRTDCYALLAALDIIANTLNLYDVVTPERVYLSCNVTHYDYTRSATNGASIIIVDIGLVEIRVTATATFSNTQQPGGAGQQSLGNVQTQTPTQAETQKLNTAGWPVVSP